MSSASRVSPRLERHLSPYREALDLALENPDVADCVEHLIAACKSIPALPPKAAGDRLEGIIHLLPGMADLLTRANPDLDRVFGREALDDYLLWLVAPDRLAGPIRIPGPTLGGNAAVRVLWDDASTEFFRPIPQPGQVWVNATTCTYEEWVELGSFVLHQQDLLGTRPRAGRGRPTGSRSQQRRQLIERIRSDPRDWSRREVYQAGVELGVWDGHYEQDPKRNWDRADRALHAARKSSSI